MLYTETHVVFLPLLSSVLGPRCQSWLYAQQVLEAHKAVLEVRHEVLAIKSQVCKKYSPICGALIHTYIHKSFEHSSKGLK